MAGKYLLGLGAAVAASQSDTVAEKARLAYLIPVRLLRDVYTAASIVTGMWAPGEGLLRAWHPPSTLVRDFLITAWQLLGSCCRSHRQSHQHRGEHSCIG